MFSEQTSERSEIFPLPTPAEQGSLLAQVGLLDPAKLPVTGSEQARKLGCACKIRP
jgi:hypothetical protein